MDGPYVKEESLKLHTIQDCAVAFSGSVHFGDKIISDLEIALADGFEPLQAFSQATVRNDPRSDVTMILVHRRNGAPDARCLQRARGSEGAR